MVPGIWAEFAPIEAAISKDFIPALVGDPLVNYRFLRKLITLPVKRDKMGLQGSVAILNPSY